MIVGHIGGGSVGGYQVQRSVRLRAGNAGNLSRTPGSAGNKKTLTYSLFAKLGALSSSRDLLTCGSAASNFFYFAVNSSDQLVLQCITGSTEVARFTAPANRRDPNAWYHITLSIDMAQASGVNGMRLWVNGEQQTITVTTYLQNSSLYINEASQAHYIGRASLSAGEYFDGYLSEVNFIDGQALTPTSFAEQDSTTRMWVPKKYTGTYGSNGFYLDFSDITSTTTLGYDKSGNGNNWTANNISLTSGVTYDSMLDVPGLPWSDGGNGRGNYCTLSPLNVYASNPPVISAGNLQTATTATNYGTTLGSISISSGKWYWEMTPTGISGGVAVGVVNQSADLSQYVGQNTNSWSYFSDGNKYTNNSATAYGATFTTNDVIGVALDLDGGTITFYKNGASQGQAYSSLSGTMFPAVSDGSNSLGSTIVANFGQRPFAYTPPTGFKALNTANLPDPTGAAAKPWEHFDVLLHTGNGGTQSVTGTAFAPDFAITKARSQANSHTTYDRVRGATNALFTNTTGAELNYSAYLAGFLSNGVSFVGGGGDTNQSSQNYVNWLWKAGGAAVSNTAGSITSQVSANTAAGFSVVTYTGTGANATVGHGLGVAPKFIIVKNRDAAGNNWQTGHASYNGGTNPFNYYIRLNTTGAQTAASTIWNNTAPTSSVFSIGSDAEVNGSTNKMVAYCFAEIAGFSRFGSYTGNGSADGPFVFCGFKPKYVLLKCSSNAGLYWFIFDSARNTYNVLDARLGANAPDAEFTGQTNLDFTANGFKVRTDQTSTNGSGYTYVYMAFAESPFKYANAR